MSCVTLFVSIQSSSVFCCILIECDDVSVSEFTIVFVLITIMH